MATQENGAAGNIAIPAAVNIVSSTDTNPIIVTATAHNLTQGDSIVINEHATNTSANGTWAGANAPTITGVNTFTIPVAGVGVGGATGYVQSQAAGGTFAIPSDGDTENAMSVNVAFEALADRAAFLMTATGALRFMSISTDGVTDTDPGGNTIWDSVTPTPISTWTDLAGGTTWTFTTANIQKFDRLFFEFHGSVAIQNSAPNPAQLNVSLWYNLHAFGASPGTYTQVPDSAQHGGVANGITSYAPHIFVPIHCTGQINVGSLNTSSITLKLMGATLDGSGTFGSFTGDYRMTMLQFRPTGLSF
jgi:hypothetical protein